MIELRPDSGQENTNMPVIKYNPFSTELEDFPTGLRLFQESRSLWLFR